MRTLHQFAVFTAVMMGFLFPIGAAESNAPPVLPTGVVEIFAGETQQIVLSNGATLKISSDREEIFKGQALKDKYDGAELAPSYYGAVRHLHYRLSPPKGERVSAKMVKEIIRVTDLHPYWSALPPEKREFSVEVKLHWERSSAIWRDIQVLGDSIPPPANAHLKVEQVWLLDGVAIATLNINQTPSGIRIFLLPNKKTLLTER